MLDSVMYTIREVCETHGVSKNTLKRRKKRLETDGIESLNESSSWKDYTKETKQSAVLDYIERGFTELEILSKY